MGLILSKKKHEAPLRLTEESLAKIAERASEKSRVSRERKLSRAKASGKMPTQISSALWKSLFAKSHKEHPCVFTVTDIHILKRHLGTIQRGGTDCVEYLTWVIESWRKVMSVKFGWMTNNRPEYPSIRFMVKFAEDFQAAFAKRKLIEERADMGLRERLIAQKTDKGMSREAAEEQVEGKRKVRERRVSEEAREMKLLQKQAEEKQRMEMRTRVRHRPRPTTSAAQPPTGDGTFGAWED